MRRSLVGGLLVMAAISSQVVAGPSPAAAASLHARTPIGEQLAELKGSDALAGDAVGVSVAISGTTAVVGAPGYAKDAGRAYVYSGTAGHWEQVAELKGADTVSGDFFGYSVAISGTTVVASAPGYAKNAGRVLRLHRDSEPLEAGCRTEGFRHGRE